jgi:hypothetical protein
MIRSLDELRKSLVPELAPDAASNRNAQSSTESARSGGLSFPEFPVICQSSPLFTSRDGRMCRLCLRRLESAVIPRPKHARPRPSQIFRSSLEGWLKHDFVFFGESCLCEGCAKAEGFI